MASRYSVSVAEVRTTSGISENLINNSDLSDLIDDAEYQSERDINCKCVPTTVIELLQGDETNRIRCKYNPVLKVRALKFDETSVSSDYWKIDKNSGFVWTIEGAEKYYSPDKMNNRNLVRIKYDYGLLEATTTQTLTTASVESGDGVAVPVSSSSGLSANDYVEIIGFDSNVETVKVSSVTDGTNIVVDNLAQDHESGSLVTLLQTPNSFLRLVKVNASLMGVGRIVGASFDEITGYSLGDLSVQKGEPYTQWRETALQLNRERDRILQGFRIRPAVF